MALMPKAGRILAIRAWLAVEVRKPSTYLFGL
jgi:hypothetical protein